MSREEYYNDDTEALCMRDNDHSIIAKIMDFNWCRPETKVTDALGPIRRPP